MYYLIKLNFDNKECLQNEVNCKTSFFKTYEKYNSLMLWGE